MKGGDNMNREQIKCLVAGLGIASLVAGISIAAPAQAAKSGWGGGAGAGSAPKDKAEVAEQAPVKAEKKDVKKIKKTKKDVKKDADKNLKEGYKPKETPGKSGWGGSSK